MRLATGGLDRLVSVPVTTRSRRAVPLGAVADIEVGVAEPVRSRVDLRPARVVVVDLESPDARSALDAAVEAAGLPDGVVVTVEASRTRPCRALGL